MALTVAAAPSSGPGLFLRGGCRRSACRLTRPGWAVVQRSVTCAACVGKTSLPDRAWDEQCSSIEDWWDEHLWSAHASEDRTALVHQIEPNPFFEPPPFIHGWG